MSSDIFRATYFSPDIACLVAAFQGGDYLDVLAMQSLVIPPHIARDTFPHDQYAALAAALDPWLSEYGLARLPRLFDGLDDLHIIMLLHATYSGRVDVVQRALMICSVTPAMMLLMLDVAAWNNQRPVLDYLVSLPHEDGWTCSSFALIAASKGGHLDVVRFLHERFPLVPTTEDAMDMAAAEGHVDVVRYLHAHRPEGCTTRAMDAAAKNGHLDVVQFLHSNRSEGCTEQAMDGACEHGHLEVAQWLYEHRRWEGFTENAFDGAAANNHFPIVEFLHHVVQCVRNTDQATMKAIKAGHWKMVKWIRDHNRHVEGVTDEALSSAAARAYFDGCVDGLHPNGGDAPTCQRFMDAVASGDVAAIEHFVSQFPDECTLDKAMAAATKGGQVKVVRWLLHRGVRPRNVAEVVIDACKTGRLDVVKLLYQHAPSWFSVEPVACVAKSSFLQSWNSAGQLVGIDNPTFYESAVLSPRGLQDALDQAAAYGHLRIVQWLHARSLPATAAAMYGAASRGHLHVVRWLHKHRREGCPQEAISKSAAKGHFSVVRWLIRHGHLLSNSAALDFAASSGNLTMVEFLLAHRTDNWSSNAMVNAASRGHLGVLLYLQGHPTNRFLPEMAFTRAVRGGHFAVAKWLHATYGFEVTSYDVATAAFNGDLTCMQWLQTHWQGGVPDEIWEEPVRATMSSFLQKW